MLEQLAQAVEQAAGPSDEKAGRVIFLAPASEKLPNDGVLRYTTAVGVYDYKNIIPHSVVMVAQDDIAAMSCVIENAALFDVAPRLLLGVPASEYSLEFEQACWSLDKVSYDAFVADIRSFAEAEAATKAARATVHDKEKAQYTRADGSVKEFTSFNTGGIDDTIDDTEVKF